MLEMNERKVRKTYTLDPVVAAFVANKAARKVIESGGTESISESETANEILRAAMEREATQSNKSEKKSGVKPEPVAV